MSIRSVVAGACVASALSLGSAAVAAPFVIGSNAVSSRPFLGSAYTRLQAELLDESNFGDGGIVPTALSLAAPVGTITGAYLSGVDAFVLAEPGVLTTSELADLRAFVLAGGSLVLVADSFGDPGVDALLASLDGGALGASGGANAPDAYTLGSSSAVAVGPFADLRGRSVGGTLGAAILPGTATTPVAGVGDFVVAAEIARGALGPESGYVLAMGDPLFLDFFFPGSGTGFDDEDNRLLALNTFAELVGDPVEPPPPPVPAPATMAMLVTAAASVARRIRR